MELNFVEQFLDRPAIHLEVLRAWLNCFLRDFPQWADNDTDSNTLTSIGVVILATIVGGTRDAEILTQLLFLPKIFVLAVLALMDCDNSWDRWEIQDIKLLLLDDSHTLEMVDEHLTFVREEFCNHHLTGEIFAWFSVFRNRHLCNGRIEDGVDDDSLNVYEATLRSFNSTDFESTTNPRRIFHN